MQLEGVVNNQEGLSYCRFIHVFGLNCIHCRELVLPNTTFIVLGVPYNGVLHRQCAHLFNYNGHWPHGHPIVSYNVHATTD